MININRILLGIVFVAILSCSKKNHGIVNNIEKTVTTERDDKPKVGNDINKIDFQIESRIIVDYYADSIVAILANGADSNKVSIPFKSDTDKPTTCDSCLFINKNDVYSMVSSYQINDSLFLLPVLDFNRILLFGVNFKAKKILVNEKLGDGYLSSSLEAIVYNVTNNQVGIANSLNFNEDQEVEKITVHFFKVGGNGFNFLRTIDTDVPKDLNSELSSMRLTLKKLSKM